MRLLISIGVSLICGMAVAAALFRYVVEHAARPQFWDSDPLGILWASYGGAGGSLVLSYALFSFVLVTCFAYADLAAARGRLARAVADGQDEPPDRQWRAAFAGTDFRTIAGQLAPFELGAAPLALLRILRMEIWRVYTRRLLCVATVAVGLAGMVVALGPWRAPAPVIPAAAGQWQALGAILLVAIAAATWLVMDNAIGRLAMTMTRLSTAWADAPAALDNPDRDVASVAAPLVRSVDDIVFAVDRLVAELAAKPSPGPQAGAPAATAAIEALKTTLREAADEQRQAIDRLGEQLGERLAAQNEDIARRLELARPAELDAAALGAAMSQLAAAVDKLADPVLRRMQLLAATDRRLLAVLRRQEDAVGSVTNRWSELVAALQAMSAGLESFAETAARHAAVDPRMVPSAGPAEVTDELQELLDEISATGTK